MQNPPADYDVLCAGLIVADHLCAPVPRIPPAGELITTDRLELSIGGCASNVAVDLARLGVDVGIVGRIGDDPLGRFVRESLESQRVRCEQITVSTTAQTSGTLVVNVQGEDRRFIHAVGANAEFTGRELSGDVIRQARLLYVGGFALNAALSGENTAALFRTAREAGVTTVLDVVIDDPEPVWRMLEPVLPFTDYFLPNVDEGRLITGVTSPWEQAARFREAGARTVVITGGKDGAFLVDAEQRMHLPAHDVVQVDGTGGGDAFGAGFIYGLLQRLPLDDCLRYGAAMGASCVRATGATTGVFRKDELEAFLRDHPLIAQQPVIERSDTTGRPSQT